MEYDPTSIVVVSVILPLLAVVAVGLRFWVRLRVQPTYLGIDDWLILAAVIFSIADAANLIVGAVLGILGRNYPGEIPEDRHIVQKKSDYAQLILEKPLYAMFKLSFLFFFRRIFRVQKTFRWFNDIMIILTVAWAVAFMLADIFVCGGNPTVLWDANATSTTACINQTWLDLWYSITDTITDFLVIIMPFPYIRKLKMSTSEKIGVGLIFALGALSTAACVARLAFISMEFTADYASEKNVHGASTPPSVWSMIEAATGVLAACLPPLGPLIRKMPNPKKMSMSSLYHRLTRSSERHESGDDLKHHTSKQSSVTKEMDAVAAGEQKSPADFV